MNRPYSKERTVAGIETMSVVRKGQVKGVDKGDIRAQVRSFNQVFGIAA